MTDKTLSAPVIGVAVLVWRKKQLLLGKRVLPNKNYCWQFPGGHLEIDETVIQCAQRELAEETGLSVKNCRHLGFTDKLFSIKSREYITLYVTSDYEAGEAQVLEPNKCEMWQWFDYAELPTPLFKPIDIYLKQININQKKNLYALHKDSEKN